MENMDPNKKPSEKILQSQETEESKSSNSISLLAQVTTLAWNLVIPIVGGVMLGYYLDQRTGDGFTWTLSLLVLGVLIAFSNLYNLYIEHGRDQIDRDRKYNTDKDSHEEEDEE